MQKKIIKILSVILLVCLIFCGTATEAYAKTSNLERPSLSVSNEISSGKIKLSWNAIDDAVRYQVYISMDNQNWSKLITTKKTSMTHSDAAVGTTYYYKVRAIAEESSANSAFSTVKKRVCDLARPALTVSNVASSGKIKLSWEKVDGAVKYEVYRSTDNKSWKLLKTTTDTSLTNNKANAETTYYYKVKAIAKKSDANSAFSSVKKRVCDLERPSLKVSNEASSGKIKLSWNAVDDAIQYQVYVSTDNQSWTKLKTTNKTSITHDDAAIGTTYYYKVRAIAKVSSANSAFSIIKERSCILASPTVSASFTAEGYPQLKWPKVENAVKYRVYRKAVGEDSYTNVKTTSNTSYIDKTANGGTEYTYKVKALAATSSANSSSSSAVSIITRQNIGFVNRNVWTIAHRGFHVTDPQNSIQAMIAAINEGFDLIEIDIQKCKDGTYVLSHYDKIKLYLDGNAETIFLSEMNYQDISDYTWDKKGKYQIETLQSFFNTICKYDIDIICDLKSGRNDEVVQIASDTGMLDRIMLSYISPQAALDDIELLNKYPTVPLRVIPLSFSQTVLLKNSIGNELFADINASVGYYREYCLNIGLSCDLPVIFAGCTMDNTAVWAGVADGCMANNDLNISVSQFQSAVAYNVQNPCSIRCIDQLSLSVNESVDFMASSDTSDTAGYIYAYSLDPNIVSMRQVEFGQNSQIQVTAISEGTTAIRLFTASGCTKDVLITISTNEVP